MTPAKLAIVVIGGGIAGASIAARLAEHAHVTLLEMEDQPGYHSTGRSAALFSETYGNPAIRALSRASREFFFAPPDGFSATRLVHPRLVVLIGRTDQRRQYELLLAHDIPGTGMEVVDPAAAMSLCPVLREDGLLGGIIDRRSADIEVHALHHGFLGQLKQRGGTLIVNAAVRALHPDQGDWIIETSQGDFRAGIVVNAAGAWAGAIGKMAGALEIGLEPRRRTVVLIDPPVGADSATWPMIMDVAESFYLKPDAGLLLLSPADETLDEPGDAQPEELDIAIAADRLQAATTIEITHIRSKWAGLRSFVADRSPVVGFDPVQRGFFWMAALGGYGIQTAPALSALAASLILQPTGFDSFAIPGLDMRELAPSRIRQGATI